MDCLRCGRKSILQLDPNILECDCGFRVNTSYYYSFKIGAYKIYSFIQDNETCIYELPTSTNYVYGKYLLKLNHSLSDLEIINLTEDKIERMMLLA
jgi:hypothetical protein